MNRSTLRYKATLLATTALIAVGAFSDKAYSLGEGGNVVNGSADIIYAAKSVTIDQNSDVVGINWNSLNTAADESLIFNQPNSSSLAVNKVIGSGDLGTIFDGILSANGNVVILDQNGIVFGRNSSVDVGGLVASTGDTEYEDTLDSEFTLNNFGDGSIVNKGTIKAADYGVIALVGNNIRNDGLIEARFGKIALATGDVVTVDLYGDNLLEVAIKSTVATSIKNYGMINVGQDDFTGFMPVPLVTDIADDLIYLDGFEEAAIATMDVGGKITIYGDNVKLYTGSELNADGNGGGGEISVTGTSKLKVYDGAYIHAPALVDGKGGSIELISSNLDFYGLVSATGAGEENNGGSVKIGDADLYPDADITLMEGSYIDVSSDAYIGNGGRVDIIGGNIDIRGHIDAISAESEGNGGGIFITGGDVTVDSSAGLHANSNATDEGNGGTIFITGINIDIKGELDVTSSDGYEENLGDGGFIGIHGDDVTIGDNGGIYAYSYSEFGNGGTVEISADNFDITGEIDAEGGFGEGNGGTILIETNDFTSLESSWISASAYGDEGNGGTITIIADRASIRGDIYANGEGVEGDGGNIAISGTDYLAITGDVSAHAHGGGAKGTISIDPIKLNVSKAHVDGESFILESSLSGMLDGADVTLIATDNIAVHDGIDVSTNGGDITTGDLTFDTDVLNIEGEFTVGSGSVDFLVNTINLGNTILRRENDIDPTVALDRGNSTTTASTVNVLNDNASIQQGVEFVDLNGTVNVSDGDYNENLIIDKVGVSVLAAPSLAARDIGRDAVGVNIHALDSSDAVYIDADNVTFSGFNILDGRTGIYINEADNVVVSNNLVTSPDFAGGSEPMGTGVGIYAYRSDNVSINGNKVVDADKEGIMVYKSDSATIIGNEVDGTESDGIEVRQSDDSVVEDNLVDGASTEGIEVTDSNNVDVIDNIVTNSGTGIRINGNKDTITNIVVSGNDISFSRNNGIYANNVVGLDILDNYIEGTGYEGIGAYRVNDLMISNNDIIDAGTDGIIAEFTGYSLFFSSFDAPASPSVSSVIIDGNDIINPNGNGVYVTGYDYSEITDNNISGSGENGIKVNNGSYYKGFKPTISFIDTANYETVITGNNILSSDTNGIEISGMDEAVIDDNFVSSSDDNGIYISGYDNGDISLQDNLLVDNSTGMKFESGLIDLTGNSNIITGGQIGLNFKKAFEILVTRESSDMAMIDWDSFNIGLNSSVTFNQLGSTSIIVNRAVGAGVEPTQILGRLSTNILEIPELALVDNTIGTTPIIVNRAVGAGVEPTQTLGRLSTNILEIPELALVDNTIGTTSFNGQSDFFIQLENGALFNPGTPTVIDGTNARYNGLRPSTSGLTQAQYDAIETGIYHYNDEDTLGLFNFGTVNPDLGSVDLEDIFPDGITATRFAPASPSLTISGFPSTGFTGQGGFNAANLNNIAPQAGGDNEGSGDADDLANIEPASGGDDVTCWGDMASAMSSGQSVSFSFGVGAEQMMSSMFSCGSSSL